MDLFIDNLPRQVVAIRYRARYVHLHGNLIRDVARLKIHHLLQIRNAIGCYLFISQTREPRLFKLMRQIIRRTARAISRARRLFSPSRKLYAHHSRLGMNSLHCARAVAKFAMAAIICRVGPSLGKIVKSETRRNAIEIPPHRRPSRYETRSSDAFN